MFDFQKIDRRRHFFSHINSSPTTFKKYETLYNYDTTVTFFVTVLQHKSINKQVFLSTRFEKKKRPFFQTARTLLSRINTYRNRKTCITCKRKKKILPNRGHTLPRPELLKYNHNKQKKHNKSTKHNNKSKK